jgi:hypothetical protein
MEVVEVEVVKLLRPFGTPPHHQHIPTTAK